MRINGRWILGGAAAAALALTLSPALGGEGATRTFSLLDAEGEAGGNAGVTLQLDADDGSAVSAGVDITFNEADLTFTTPVADSCTLDERIASTHQIAGRILSPGVANIEILVAGTPDPLPPLGNGPLAVCNFGIRSDANPGDMFPVGATNVFIGDDLGAQLDAATDDGVITVVEGGTPTPTETPTVDTPTPTEMPTEPTEVPTCTSDADCPDGQRCQLDGETGTCVPDDCETDMDCDLNETCDDGTCHDLPCGDGCPLGTVCDTETNTCQLIPCTGNEMCPENTTCENGFCTPECRFDSDCPGGFCVNSLCVECRDDEDCDDGEFCDDGNTCQENPTGDSLVVTGGVGVAGGTASLMVAFAGDGASAVANTLSIADAGLAIAACTAAGEIPSSFEITNDGGSSVAAELGGEGSSISEGALYACDVSIAAGTEPGSKPVTCSGATSNGTPIPCNDAAIVVEAATPTPTQTPTPTNTFTPTLTFTPTDVPTNTPLPRGGDEDDGCAVVAPQSGSSAGLFLLLAPALLLWRRRREW